jgi:hypothetical protein
LISRRAFVSGALTLLAWPRSARAGTPAGPSAETLGPDGRVAPALVSALEASRYAYVSPLRSDGSESVCHGEVWFAWLDGAVVTTTAAERWKARAVARGLARARIWVGDHGRWKQLGGSNEAFRRAPSFEARAHRVDDSALLERVLAVYEKKYPEEIGRWRERMRAEVASGKRVILRYVPLPSGG